MNELLPVDRSQTGGDLSRDDFQCHGTVKIDVKRLVSDAHRTPTQLDRFAVFARHQLIVLKALDRLFRVAA